MVRKLLILSSLTFTSAPQIGHPTLATAADLSHETSHETDRAAILEALNAQQLAWNRGDVNAFLEGYWHSPEVSFSGANGIVRGWDAIEARYKKTYVDRDAMGQLRFSDLEFRFLGPDAALVLGHWHLTRAKGDVGGVFSLVWERLPGGWRIVHDHTSVVPDAN
jgi:ketosteroid isomerase-like protein